MKKFEFGELVGREQWINEDVALRVRSKTYQIEDIDETWRAVVDVVLDLKDAEP